MTNRCPACGMHVRGLELLVTGKWQAWPCGDVITQEMAEPVLRARGDI